jgi:hypothetical protein
MSLAGAIRQISRGLIYLVCFIVMHCILAQGALVLAGTNVQGNLLQCVWEIRFTRINGECIQWIGMRLIGWILVYLTMMRLESRFTIFLFIRQRNYLTLFLKMYVNCLYRVLLYFALSMAVMAFFYSGISDVKTVGMMLFRKEMFAIYIKECFGCLNFCLAVYLVYCLTKRAEISFLAVLACRLMGGVFIQGLEVGMIAGIALNLLLAGVALMLSAHNFADRISGMEV